MSAAVGSMVMVVMPTSIVITVTMMTMVMMVQMMTAAEHKTGSK